MVASYRVSYAPIDGTTICFENIQMVAIRIVWILQFRRADQKQIKDYVRSLSSLHKTSDSYSILLLA